VVNKSGKIAYIGHPMRLQESMLASLLAEPSTKSAGPAVEAGPSAPSAKAGQLSKAADALIQSGKLDEAEPVIAELHQELPPKFQYIGGLMEMKLLLARKQSSDAIEFSKILCEDFAGRPEVLNAVAATLVSRPDASPALLTAAEKIATPLSKADGEAKSAALATLARIASVRGGKPTED
jgi:outer membrane PBP1 activator LpoA protein